MRDGRSKDNTADIQARLRLRARGQPSGRGGQSRRMRCAEWAAGSGMARSACSVSFPGRRTASYGMSRAAGSAQSSCSRCRFSRRRRNGAPCGMRSHNLRHARRTNKVLHRTTIVPCRIRMHQPGPGRPYVEQCFSPRRPARAANFLAWHGPCLTQGGGSTKIRPACSKSHP